MKVKWLPLRVQGMVHGNDAAMSLTPWLGSCRPVQSFIYCLRSTNLQTLHMDCTRASSTACSECTQHLRSGQMVAHDPARNRTLAERDHSSCPTNAGKHLKQGGCPMTYFTAALRKYGTSTGLTGLTGLGLPVRAALLVPPSIRKRSDGTLLLRQPDWWLYCDSLALSHLRYVL